MTQAMIELKHVDKVYARPGGGDFAALRGINLRLLQGQFTALLGKSGSGKSTLLNLITGLDRPTRGTICVGGTALNLLNEDALAVWRGQNVGIVFQFFQLLPTLTVLENLLLAMDFCAVVPGRERHTRALDLLRMVDITDQAHKLPATLSGGQQQRVAIARAMVNNPDIIVADEPTGNLDTTTAAAIIRIFKDLVHQGKTLLLVTHDYELACHAHTIVELVDGTVHALKQGSLMEACNESSLA